MADESQFILERTLADGMSFAGQQLGFPLVAVGDRAEGFPVVSQLMGAETGQEFGAMPDKGQALAQEGAQRTPGAGINIGWGDEIGPEQVGQFFGVNAVVLVLAAVNGLEVEGVGQDEGDAGLLAGVGQPIPAEHAFGADGQVVAVGFNQLEEEAEVVVLDVGVDQLFAALVHEADVHLAGMKVNSTS